MSETLYMRHETLKVYSNYNANKIIYGRTQSNVLVILTPVMMGLDTDKGSRSWQKQEPVAILRDDILYKRLRFTSNHFIATQVEGIVNEELYKDQFALKDWQDCDEQTWSNLVTLISLQDRAQLATVALDQDVPAFMKERQLT